MPDAPSKPAPPVLDGTEEQARGEDFLNIRWSAASNAVRYRIQCNTEIQEFSGPNIPYKTTFRNLPHNTKHTLTVVAFNEDGDSAKSDTFECYTRPAPPSNLVLVPGNSSRDTDQVTLRWTPVAEVPSYHVTATPRGTKEFGPPASAGHVFSGLEPNTQYQFIVRSYDPAKGGLSLNASPVLRVATRPPRPKPSATVDRPWQVTITWQTIPVFSESEAAGVRIDFFAVYADGTRKKIHPSEGIAAGSAHCSLSDSKGFHIEGRVVTPLTSPENASFWSEPSSFIEEAEMISVSSKPIIEKLLKGNEQQRQGLLNRYFN